MRLTSPATALTCAAVLASGLLAGCSGGASTSSTTTTASASTTATVGASDAPSTPPPATTGGSTTERATRTATPTAPATAVALPAGHQWLAVPALHTRLAIPTTWRVVDLTTLREQKDTPAFAQAAESLGYTVEELTDFTRSGAVAMAVGPDAGETAPNLLVRSFPGGEFTSGEQLTSASRGTTGVLDAQSEPTTPAGPGVRGDFHVAAEGLTVHSSQLAVTVGGQQDVVAVSAADAATVQRVMGTVVQTYSPAS